MDTVAAATVLVGNWPIAVGVMAKGAGVMSYRMLVTEDRPNTRLLPATRIWSTVGGALLSVGNGSVVMA